MRLLDFQGAAFSCFARIGAFRPLRALSLSPSSSLEIHEINADP